MFRLLRNKKGFTLIELMIVVAIIAILAAIAIPNFINYRYKARTAEAKSNIGSINTLEEAYAADVDNYLSAVWTGTITSSTGKASWTAGTYLEGIGFKPKGTVYYVYGVGTTAPVINTAFQSPSSGMVTANTSTNIYIMASGDLDKDASDAIGGTSNGNFYATDEARKVIDNIPTQF